MPDPDMLFRSVPFEMRAAGTDGDGLTLEGYAAVFSSPTRIDSWEGVFDEEIARGAFKKSLQERTPVLQFDHGRHPMVGSIPLGSFDRLREDEHGLDVKARLHDNWLIAPVRDAIKSEAIPGMSFRFEVVKDEWRTAAGRSVKGDDVARLLYSSDPGDPESVLKRTLREVRLFELGPVVFPAYADTNVSVRSQLVSLLSDPQVRADFARLLVGTPSESSDDTGSSDEGRAATPTEEPPPALPVARIPSPAARARALTLESESRHG